MHKPHLLFATKDKFTGNKSLIKAQYWGAFLSSHYGLSNSSFSKVLHIWLLKMKKGLRADTPHPHNNSTFFPLQLLHAKYTQQQHQEECFTHSATIWHLQNLSIHQMVHSLILHLLRLEGKKNLSLLLFSPTPWTREVKCLGPPNTGLSAALLKEIPWAQAILQGLVFEAAPHYQAH